jgi:hypothetical protein
MKTAVEWLIDTINKINHDYEIGIIDEALWSIQTYEAHKQAKEMELDQRKNDYRAGWNNNKHKDWNCEFYLEKHLTNFETFKSE